MRPHSKALTATVRATATPAPSRLPARCRRWVPGTARFVALGCRPRGTGLLQVYELDGAQLERVAQAEQPSALKCGSFGAAAAGEQHLAAGNHAGQLQVLDLERLGSGPVFTVQAHRGMLNALDAFGGRVSGGADCLGGCRQRWRQRQCGGVRIAAVFRLPCLPVRFCLQASGCGGPEIATCGQDGGVRVWDTRQPGAPAAAFLPEAGSGSSGSGDAGARDCWCVAIGNSYNGEERCVLAGYANGDIKMFDLRTSSVRWQTNVGKGVCGLQVGGRVVGWGKFGGFSGSWQVAAGAQIPTCQHFLCPCPAFAALPRPAMPCPTFACLLQFDRRDIQMNKFVATCLESQLCLFDARTQHPARGFAARVDKLAARDATLWSAQHLPQSRDIFMLAGGDGSLSLHKYRYPDQRCGWRVWVGEWAKHQQEGPVGTQPDSYPPGQHPPPPPPPLPYPPLLLTRSWPAGWFRTLRARRWGWWAVQIRFANGPSPPSQWLLLTGAPTRRGCLWRRRLTRPSGWGW